MEHLFVDFETAKKLKEKGFNQDCFGCYCKNNQRDDNLRFIDSSACFKWDTPAPLYQQVDDWLSDKHHIEIAIKRHDDGYLEIFIYKYDNSEEVGGCYIEKYTEFIVTYDKYEAWNKAIKEALKLI